jgi:hypothetical protein
MGKVQDKKKEQHWRRLLHEQKASGKSVAVFCGERRIRVSVTFVVSLGNSSSTIPTVRVD